MTILYFSRLRDGVVVNGIALNTKKPLEKSGFFRAGDEIRTRGLLLGKETFYH